MPSESAIAASLQGFIGIQERYQLSTTPAQTNARQAAKLRAIPLPYLTSLLKTHIKDYASVVTYIREALIAMAVEAMHCSNTWDQPQQRAANTAMLKQHFTYQIYLGGASTQVKKDILSIPFEEFLGVCVRELSVGTFNTPMGYLAQAELASDFEVQVASKESFPGLTSATQKMLVMLNRGWPNAGNVVRTERLTGIIQQFVKLAMNAVDLLNLYQSTNPANQQRRQEIWREGKMKMLWAWKLMLNHPFSDMSPLLRMILSETNIAENIEYLCHHVIPQLIRAGIDCKHLHYVVYLDIFSAAIETKPEYTPQDVEFLGEVVVHHFSKPVDLPAAEHQVPQYYRPEGTHDQITAAVEGTLRLQGIHGDQEAVIDIPVEPSGPLIDPLQMGRVVTEVDDDESCAICQIGFKESAEAIVKLHVCGHILHQEFLEGLINRAYMGSDKVMCPNCRARICAARDYKAVLEA
ncbi:hypothetical protein EK21DRAFT_94198 [Setomelanomma holmii]|uniref:RING-type domain-containing protein n=1 Tax=Setomelanomma holmii TaxID=210430 RepID=A0A9P4GZE0_9PLEO|nr:hypothetical protein EK21DRAFT_94198 [Setomelanomma holmii]